MRTTQLSNYIISILCLVLLSTKGLAQDKNQDSGPSQADKVAKQLANPNATLGFMAIPIDYITYNGGLPGASSQNGFKVNWQPSLPYSLGKGTNLFLRPLVPIIVNQPQFTGQGFENKGVELGDIGFDLALGHSFESKWMGIIGIAGSMPSATLPSLGATQWTLGPEFFLGKTTSWGFFGALITHSWGLAETSRYNITAGQYFYTINLGNAWQVQAQPTYSYNHNGTSGNKLSVPLATGIAKTMVFGKMPIKFGLQYWYYAASPDLFGPEHQIRFTIVPVVPLPW